MMTTSLRLRVDLQATPVEDADGVLYYDISDPKTGSVLRLFDFEWLLAQRIDGKYNFDELAGWTEAELGFSPSRADLEIYSERLQQLGLLDQSAVASETAASSKQPAPAITPLTPQKAAQPTPSPVVTAPKAAQTGPSPVVTAQKPAQLESLPVAPAAAPLPEPPQAAAPVAEPRRVEPEAVSPAMPAPSAADSDDGLMGRPVISLPQARPQPSGKVVVPPTTPVSSKLPSKPSSELPSSGKAALQEALAGLPTPTSEVAAARSGPQTPPPAPAIEKAPAAASTGPQDAMQAPAAEKPPAAAIEKGPALSVAPTALLEQISSQPQDASATSEPMAPPLAEMPAKPAMVPPAPTSSEPPAKVGMAAPAPASSEPPAKGPIAAAPPIASEPPAKAPVAAAPSITSEPPAKAPAPPVAKPPQITPEASPAPRPVESELMKSPGQTESQPQGGGAGKWIAILLVLVAALAAYYFLVYKGKMHPAAVPVQVSEAKVEDVPNLLPAEAEVKQATPQTLKIEGAGTVVKIAAENDEVTPETPLLVLDTKAKLEKEQSDLRIRIEQLQKKVDTAKGKAKQDTQNKIDEKQARLSEIETLLKKTQLMPARPGVVSKVLVKAGEAVDVDTEVVTVTDKAPIAEIKVPALEAQGMKAGTEAQLSTGTGPDSKTIKAQLVSLASEGEFSTLVFSLPMDAAVKPGDKLRLQRGVLEKVVRVPESALVDGNRIYTIQEGKATAQKVTVKDRDSGSGSVLVQGLSSGDAIIVSPPAAGLQEGTAVAPAASAPNPH